MVNNKYNLPVPTAIEVISLEEIIQENVKIFKEQMPEWLPVETDAWMIAIESFSYKELFLRKKINEKILKMLPQYSNKADLDNFVFSFYGGIKRIKNESDDKFLERAMLSVNRFSTAGSANAYIYYTLLNNALVQDVKVINTIEPLSSYIPLFTNKNEDEILSALRVLMSDMATVKVYITSNSIIKDSLIEEINSNLNDEKIRPLTDRVLVQRASIVEIDLVANVELYNLAQKENITKEILKNFEKIYKIADDVIKSNIIASLHINGVYRVSTNLNADLSIEDTQVAKINLSLNFTQAVPK